MKRRLMTVAKWVCTLCAGAAIGVAASSAFFSCERKVNNSTAATMLSIGLRGGLVWAGRGEIVDWDTRLPSFDTGWSFGRSQGWWWGLAGEDLPTGTLGFWRAGTLWYRNGRFWNAGLSLAYPVLVTTAPAALLWYADRRRFGPGRCAKCGYSRRGLAESAKCPECGTTPTPTRG